MIGRIQSKRLVVSHALPGEGKGGGKPARSPAVVSENVLVENPGPALRLGFELTQSDQARGKAAENHCANVVLEPRVSPTPRDSHESQHVVLGYITRHENAQLERESERRRREMERASTSSPTPTIRKE